MHSIEQNHALLNQLKIVLVEPTHPGNIGSVARAMKTMGLSNLVLVNPKKFPHYEASKLAAGAESVLDDAVVVENVEQAVADCTLVLGTSVRDREVSWPTKNPRQTAEFVFEHSQRFDGAQTAILFGRESSGLTNDELALCQTQIRIDANPQYSSLNLASAVQIIAYELRMRALESCQLSGSESNKEQVNSATNDGESATGLEKRQQAANKEQLDGHLQHLQLTLEALNFTKAKPPTILMRKLTRLYNKAELTVEEIQILRGILSAVQQSIDE